MKANIYHIVTVKMRGKTVIFWLLPQVIVDVIRFKRKQDIHYRPKPYYLMGDKDKNFGAILGCDTKKNKQTIFSSSWGNKPYTTQTYYHDVDVIDISPLCEDDVNALVQSHFQ